MMDQGANYSVGTRGDPAVGASGYAHAQEILLSHICQLSESQCGEQKALCIQVSSRSVTSSHSQSRVLS